MSIICPFFQNQVQLYPFMLDLLSLMITNFRNNISWNRISNSKFRRQLFHKSYNLIKVDYHSWSLSCNSLCTFPDSNKTVIIISSFSDISLSHPIKTCFIYYFKILITQSEFNLNRKTLIKLWAVIKKGANRPLL